MLVSYGKIEIGVYQVSFQHSHVIGVLMPNLVLLYDVNTLFTEFPSRFFLFPASLLLNIPLQIEEDQARPGSPLGPAVATADSSACATLCQANTACQSWSFLRASRACQLQSDAPLNRYELGTDAGVRGSWIPDADGKVSRATVM